MRTLQVFLVGCLLLVSAWAPAQPRRASETYRLRSEDVIFIQIFRVPEVEAVLPIGPDGNISAPFVGTVKAAGKTTKELEYDLKLLYVDRLKLRDPIVSVTIRQFRAIRATIGGFVSRPGMYEVRPGDRLLDLLNQGGGTSTDGRADLRRAFLLRKGSQERIPIDLNSMLLRGDNSQNFEIEDGDALIVPEERDNRIIVAGRVRQSGSQAFRESMTVYEAVQQAGQVERRSRLSRVQVIRRVPGRPGDYVSIECNLVAFENKNDAKQNIVLKPGDLIYVPDSGNIEFDIITSVANLFFIFDRLGFDPLRIQN